MKYIFIDTNQYRHIFSKNEGFSDEIKNLLDGLIKKDHIKLLLPQQVKDEVERNRFENWFNDEMKDVNKKIEQRNTDLKKHEEALVDYPAELKSVKKKIAKEISLLQKELLVIKKKYRNLKSKANQKLKDLFNEAEYIPETDSVVARAQLRLEKNNPPNDNKLGDALIWESIIEGLKLAEKKSILIFIARDDNAWGKDGFNPWLERELKEKTGVSISLTRALSDLDYLTKEEQKKLRKIEREESKNNAVSNFVSSQSFVSAGSKIQSVLAYKDILTKDDYVAIIKASISNHEIYQSFFTSTPLNSLCEGENGYVVPHLEDITQKAWDKFVKLNQIKAKRQSDLIEEIDNDESPF